MPQAPMVTLSSLDYCETIIYKADEYVTPNGMRQCTYQGITLICTIRMDTIMEKV